MILRKYILKRFFINVFSINIGLTFLFSLIEFFEKMVRVQQTTSGTIFYFIALNLAPSFFENIPVSSWLASCLTLKEMEQQNEWEIIKLLNIKFKKIFSLIFFAGIFLSVFSFFGKEVFVHKLTQSAEKFKQEKFKQNSNKKIFNKWFMIDNKTFFHFNYLDLKTKSGTNISILKLSPKFKIKEIFNAQKFSILPKTKEILISSGIATNTITKEQNEIKNKKFFSPGFFTQLQMEKSRLSINQMASIIIFEQKTLPTNVYHQLLYTFLSRIFENFLPLFYILLTFMLFLIFPYNQYYRWISSLSVYPLSVVLFTITGSIIKIFQYGIVAIIPYAILSFLIATLWILLSS